MARTRTRLTERLRLEPVTLHSSDRLLELHADPGIAAWNGGVWDAPKAASFAAGMAEHWSGNGVGKWLVYDRANGQLVGRGGLSYIDLLGQRQLEVGWQIREQHWGRGFATEVGRAALHVAFDELDAGHVVAFTEVHNTNSRRMMQRLGMQYVQEFRRRGLVAGTTDVRDDAFFALYCLERPS